MKLTLIAAAAVTIALSGCAVQKTLTPTGGSRSDGVVRLSYVVGAFEKPVVDYSQAQQAAMQRCSAWGYSDAQPFGGETSQCQAYNQYGCVQALITVEYQCMGQPEAAVGVLPVPVPQQQAPAPQPKAEAEGVTKL